MNKDKAYTLNRSNQFGNLIHRIPRKKQAWPYENILRSSATAKSQPVEVKISGTSIPSPISVKVNPCSG